MSTKKKSGKVRNKIDPIIALAQKNKAKSLTVSDDTNNQKIIKNNYSRDNDFNINDSDANKLFREMKKLPYQE